MLLSTLAMAAGLFLLVQLPITGALGQSLDWTVFEPSVVFGVGDWADGVNIIHCRWQVRAVRETLAAGYADKPRAIAVRCKRVRYS